MVVPKRTAPPRVQASLRPIVGWAANAEPPRKHSCGEKGQGCMSAPEQGGMDGGPEAPY